MRFTQFTRLAFLTLFALLAFQAISPFALAQSALPSRITGAVNENSLTTLHGNITSRAEPKYDLGAAAPSTQLTHLRLVLKRSVAQEAALRKFMAQQLDPSSPNYHKWLTPEQFALNYGLSDEDINTLTQWIESHGLTVESVARGRDFIFFSGSVSQVEEMLHTQIHSFNANGEKFLSNITEPQIPTALVPVVMGIGHLNTINPHPYFIKGIPGHRDPKTNQLKPLKNNRTGEKPNLTSQYYCGANCLYLTPMDAATIYDTPNTTFNINYPSGTTYDGTGVTIGVAGDSAISQTTLGFFHSVYMNSNLTNTTEVDTGSVSITGDQDESYIDLELASGLAPGASIIYYPSSDLFSGMVTAINTNAVDIFSVSYGSCEWALTTAENTSLNNLWEQAAAQGISVTVSAGDTGPAGCDDQNTETAAIYGAQVSGFASTPFNIAVGGTDFYDLLNNFSTYVSSNNNPTYGGSAKGFIPESSWNDSTASWYVSPGWDNAADSSLDNNFPWDALGLQYAQYDSISAGSGGPSVCSTNTTTIGIGGTNLGTCTSGYAKPAWQTGPGVPADGARDIPDVSLMAGNGAINASWLVCTDDTDTNNGAPNGSTLDCDPATTNDFNAFGGTSTAAPAFAGILAQVNQKVGARLGQAASVLYALAAGANGSTIFHDTVIGNNSVSCDTTQTPDGSCQINTAGYPFQIGYNTGIGYDLSTGLGSVDANQLVINYPTPAPPTTTFFISAADLTLAAGATTNNTSTITITPSGGYTGTVTWTAAVTTAPSNAVGTPTFTSSAGLVFTAASSLAQSGTVTVDTTGATAMLRKTSNIEYARYNNWLKAAAGMVFASFILFFVPTRVRKARNLFMTLLFTVAIGFTIIGCSGNSTPTYLTPTVTVSPASSSIAYNSSLNVNISVSGTGATPTGTVTLTSGNFSSTATLANGSGSITIPANTFTSAGTYTLTGNYSGDNNYNSATGSASEKVTGPPTTPGNYTITVTAVGSDAASTTKSTTFTLTVN